MKVIAHIYSDIGVAHWVVRIHSYKGSNDELEYWTSTYRHKQSVKRAAKRFAKKHRFTITEWEES